MYFKSSCHSIPEVTPETRLVIIEKMLPLMVFKVPSKLEIQSFWDLHELKWRREIRKAHLDVFEVLYNKYLKFLHKYLNCCYMKSRFIGCTVRNILLLLSL